MKTSNKYIITLLLSVLIFVSCTDDIDKPGSWPEWPTPSQPKIENARLTGLKGENTIMAGDLVKFVAKASDEFNNLTSYELTITIAGQTVFSKNEKLEGKTGDINIETKIPFVANFEGNTYPEVILKVVNDLAAGTSEVKLEEASNILINRPATPDKLYIVDNAGQVFELNTLDDVDYGFQTMGDLSAIGMSYKIAEKLTVDNQIDYSGLVWGTKDNKVTVIEKESDASISISVPEGDMLESISFNMFTFAANPLLANPVDVVFVSSSLPGYMEATISISEGQVVEFKNIENGIENLLRPDFFTNASGNKAKFAGPAGQYKLYYNTSDKFIYIENTNLVYPDGLWICGLGLGFPQEPFNATLQWNWWLPHEYIFCKKTADNIFETTAYFEKGFLFKFFRQRNWGAEETAHSYTMEPANWLVNAKNEWGDLAGDFGSGEQFTSGVYKIEINMNTKIVRLTKVN